MGESDRALEPRPWNRTMRLNGRRLRAARVRAGLTQGQLAASVGMNQRTLSAYEREMLQPTDGVIAALAEVLRLDVTAICRAERRRAS